MAVPSRAFLLDLPRQPPAPDLVEKLRRGFPNLGLGRDVVELCLEKGCFPHDLDCGGFALGHMSYSHLGAKPIEMVHRALTDLGLSKASPDTSDELPAFSGESAVIATFVREKLVKHFALGYLDKASKLEPIWYSKFGKGYPVLLHTLDEINGGDYGTLDSYYVCPPTKCGEPCWRSENLDVF